MHYESEVQGEHGKNCNIVMASVFLIKVSKVTGLFTQQLCGCSTKEGLRSSAGRIENALRKKYPAYGIKKEYCKYFERDGIYMGYHFTLL